MDYKELLQDRDFSSPDEICEWMDNAQKAITELVSKTEELEKQLSEAKLNRPIELSGQGAENFALAIQLSEMQQKLKEVTAERDAAVNKLPHVCETCVYYKVFFNGCTPDHDCTNPDGGCSNNYDRWAWNRKGE